jgi:hypothetical protein
MAFIGNQPFTAAFLTDTFSGTGSQVAYTMTVAPANTSSIIVAVTGVLQDPSTYSVSGTTLTFSAAPPTGTSNISVRYLGIPASGVTTTAYRTVTNFTATAGQTSFSVPSYTVGYIDVYRNGVRLVNGGTDFVATTGTTVVLNNGCSVGDAVVTESFLVSSVLNAIPATAGAVNSTYIAGGAALANIGAGGLTQTYLATNVAGTGPAFSAYQSSAQTLATATNTKITLQTEEFDTNSNFDSTTNYRFTPTVAGYYQVNGRIEVASATTEVITFIYKNGSKYKSGSDVAANAVASVVSALVFLNGTTDYIEFYGYVGIGQNLSATITNTFFQASMVRSA